jgi:hypothetical protein
MRTTQDLALQDTIPTAAAVGHPGHRLRAWLRRPDVRVALVATLALRVGLSAFAALIAYALHGAYVSTVTEMNHPINRLHVNAFAAPLQGLAGDLIGPWLRWDANNYLNIAAHGYASFGGSTAFWPLYPLLIRLGAFPLGGNLPLSALLIATAASFAMLLQLYRLVERLSGSAEVARYSVVAACLIPIAFFFMAPYTESLFLACSLSAILASLDGRWRWAAVWSVLACLARQQGLLLCLLAVPALWAALRQAWAARRTPRPALVTFWARTRGPLLLALAPIVTYAAWLAAVVFVMQQQTPWQLLTAPHGWDQRFTVPGLGIIVDTGLILLDPGKALVHLDLPLDAAAGLISAASLIALRRRLPAALLLYLIGCWCVASFKVVPSGWTVSAARYLLALLPLCMLPGTWLARGRPAFRLAFIVAGFVLSCLYVSGFVLWVWIN